MILPLQLGEIFCGIWKVIIVLKIFSHVMDGIQKNFKDERHMQFPVLTGSLAGWVTEQSSAWCIHGIGTWHSIVLWSWWGAQINRNSFPLEAFLKKDLSSFQKPGGSSRAVPGSRGVWRQTFSLALGALDEVLGDQRMLGNGQPRVLNLRLKRLNHTCRM